MSVVAVIKRVAQERENKVIAARACLDEIEGRENLGRCALEEALAKRVPHLGEMAIMRAVSDYLNERRS
ncbi:MAG: hypothetical protein Q4G45_03235 [Actinomycetia bacterium]|nr:hypothetical protein [Actinomycetes bacterium]